METAKTRVGAVCGKFENTTAVPGEASEGGEPWGRKRCGLKAGGRFAPSCSSHRPATRVGYVSAGTPKSGAGHLLGGQNPLKFTQELRKRGLFRGIPVRWFRSFSEKVWEDIKRLLAIYLEQNVTINEFEDYDGESWVVMGEE